MKLAITLLRFALAAVLSYAALTKLPEMQRFAEEIANYRLLPSGWVAALAAAVPGIELTAGVLLAVGWWVRPAAILTGALLLAFMAALTQALLRHIDLRCGCFGGSELATWGTVARDAAMLAACALVLWRSPNAAAPRVDPG